MGAHTKWTDLEKTTAAQAVASGHTHIRDMLPLFPGRSRQHVWNIIAMAKRAESLRCPCGATMPKVGGRCDECNAKRAAKVASCRVQGICVSCRKLPADATLTFCQACRDRKRARVAAGRPTYSGGWSRGSGVVRWRSGAMPRQVLPHLLDDSWTFVDVFGGSAAIAMAMYGAQPVRPVVYNDIHPTLCDLLDVIQAGMVGELVSLCEAHENLSPDQLITQYQARSEESPVVRASLLLTLAQSVRDRDFFRLDVPEVRGLPKEYARRMRGLEPALVRTTVLNRDFADVIAEYDSPRTLFFVDPPYPNTEFYEHNLTFDRFASLVTQLDGIQGRYFLLTNSTRASAEAINWLRYRWWFVSHNGVTRHHLLAATNYPVDLPPIDMAAFGIGIP